CLDNNSFSAPPARRQIQILTFSYPLSKTFSYPFLMQSPHLSNSLRVCAITCEKLSCRARYVIFSNSFIVSVDMISFILGPLSIVVVVGNLTIQKKVLFFIINFIISLLLKILPLK